MRTIAGRTLGVALGVVVVALLAGATTGISTRQVRTAAPGVVNVSGVAAAEGSSLAVCRADHTHSLTGILPVANGGSGSSTAPWLPLSGGTMAGTMTVGASGAKFDSSGDLWAVRTGGTTGVIFLNAAGSRYLYYNGSNYDLPGAGLTLGGGLSVSGAITATGDITAFSTSDRRLKSNLRPISDPLAKLAWVHGVEWDWVKASGRSGPGAGVIAQDVQRVLPTMVGTTDKGYLALKVGDQALTGLLIEVVKAQQLQIKELGHRVEALEWRQQQ